MTPRGPRRAGASAVAALCSLALAAGPVAALPTPVGDARAPLDEVVERDATGAGGGAVWAADAEPNEVASDTLLVTARTGPDMAAAAAALREADGVSSVRAVSRRVVTVDGDHDAARRALADHAVIVEADLVVRGAAVPDDPLFEDQWGLHNTGQEIAGRLGEEGLDVGALRAWEHTRGARDLVIAVVDTRLASHPDLDGNVLPGSGDRFVTSSPTRPCEAEHAAHATEVAGVAAAVADNGQGIAGLAPRARILPVAFLDNCGFGSLTGAAGAIVWAAANGADVVVASFASERVNNADGLRVAIEDAGVPVIAAAGNAVPGGTGEGADLSAAGAEPVFPASFSLRTLLAVASIDNAGELSRFSNYGDDDVELAAPGRAIRTTSVNLQGEPGYRYQSGTSFAAPFVAGAFALAKSLRPVLSPEGILDLILETTRPLESLEATTITGGTLDAGELVVQVARGGACPTELVPTAGFVDVDVVSTHLLAIDCIAWWEVTRGRGESRYEPAAPVTRGQMASFLATVIAEGPGLPDEVSAPFDDIATSVHREAIEALAELGIVAGFPDGTYRPDARVTREQMATFLVNTYEQLVGPAPRPDTRWFEDTAGSVHALAADALWELGITAGTGPRTYAPRPDVRRDQMASFVARLLDRLVREDVIAARGDADEEPEDDDNGGDDGDGDGDGTGNGDGDGSDGGDDGAGSDDGDGGSDGDDPVDDGSDAAGVSRG